jgi:aldose sugar dehydrogenase
MNKIIIIFIIFALSLIIGYVLYTNISILPLDFLNMLRSFRDTGQEITKSAERTAGIPLNAKIHDSNFIVEEFVTGLSQPTAMTFVGNDILILEKNTGYVKLIRDKEIISKPLLEFEVVSTNESGLLGITSYQNDVYIYVTESDDGVKIGNNIYRYTWDGNNLIDQQLVNTLSNESSWHNGGSMTVDLNGQVFAVIGDQMGGGREGTKNDLRLLQNHNNGDFDDSGVILKVALKPEIIKPMLDENPLLHYHAIGIRNSFGLTVDPLTGNLWDTENGPEDFDEINLVNSGFNSGWDIAMGPITEEQNSKILSIEGFQYSDPEFSWERTVAPTGLDFVTSELYNPYENHLLVGTCSTGQILKFKLNDDRTGFEFSSPHLQDLVANLIETESGEKEVESIDEIVFGDGFGCVTDITFGTDEFLYVVSITDNTIYRIIPI